MRKKALQTGVSAAILMVAAFSVARPRDEEGFAGTWVGTYAGEGGGSGDVTLTISKSTDGAWHANIKYSNQDGDQSAEMREIKISGAKFTGKLTSPDGGAEITLDGEIKEARLEGTYSVSEMGSTEVVEKGTWKTTRSPAGGKGQ